VPSNVVWIFRLRAALVSPFSPKRSASLQLTVGRQVAVRRRFALSAIWISVGDITHWTSAARATWFSLSVGYSSFITVVLVVAYSQHQDDLDGRHFSLITLRNLSSRITMQTCDLDLWPFDLSVIICRRPTMKYMYTNFGVDSSSRFPFRALTEPRTRRRR